MNKNTYVLHEHGITELNYVACLEFLCYKFDYKDVPSAHKLVVTLKYMWIGEDKITYKAGDKLIDDSGHVYKQLTTESKTYKDMCLISPEFWAGDVLQSMQENEKEV